MGCGTSKSTLVSETSSPKPERKAPNQYFKDESMKRESNKAEVKREETLNQDSSPQADPNKDSQEDFNYEKSGKELDKGIETYKNNLDSMDQKLRLLEGELGEFLEETKES
eukprot:TRINITY_DN10347_c0_g1_i1.p1 TRINITY_DN10347_c0_g1~~TRINITY_DN10347_c0_g1_i1.p1  ORF type:complete len:111 (+),score=37.60 TRINITY_DN10347_c0_g1_i1:55-387(+)